MMRSAFPDQIASMGPRSMDRGNGLVYDAAGRVVGASMGPRSMDRGNLAGIIDSYPGGMLQWGRDPWIAEIPPIEFK
jgi:hypothetical protein